VLPRNPPRAFVYTGSSLRVLISFSLSLGREKSRIRRARRVVAPTENIRDVIHRDVDRGTRYRGFRSEANFYAILKHDRYARARGSSLDDFLALKSHAYEIAILRYQSHPRYRFFGVGSRVHSLSASPPRPNAVARVSARGYAVALNSRESTRVDSRKRKLFSFLRSRYLSPHSS